MPEEDAPLVIPAPLSEADLSKLGSRLWGVQQQFAAVDTRKKAAAKRVNDRFDPVLARLQAEIDALLRVIVDYAVAHKDELTDTQTVRLDSMDIEWRKDGTGTLVFVSSEEDIIASLRWITGGDQHIAVKETVRKDSLKADTEVMARLGAMVAVTYDDTVTVITKPSPAQQRRGVRKIRRAVQLSKH